MKANTRITHVVQLKAIVAMINGGGHLGDATTTITKDGMMNVAHLKPNLMIQDDGQGNITAKFLKANIVIHSRLKANMTMTTKKKVVLLTFTNNSGKGDGNQTPF